MRTRKYEKSKRTKARKTEIAPQMLKTAARPGPHPQAVRDDPANIERHLELGYQFVNDSTGSGTEHEHPHRTGDGTTLTNAKKYRELVLMELPDELYRERTAALRERTDAQTTGLKALANFEDARAASASGLRKRSGISGKIVIE